MLRRYTFSLASPCPAPSGAGDSAYFAEITSACRYRVLITWGTEALTAPSLDSHGLSRAVVRMAGGA